MCLRVDHVIFCGCMLTGCNSTDQSCAVMIWSQHATQVHVCVTGCSSYTDVLGFPLEYFVFRHEYTQYSVAWHLLHGFTDAQPACEIFDIVVVTILKFLNLKLSAV
jgi:hypothetical protein